MRLLEKGRLVEVVVMAGLFLDALLFASPLSRSHNPPSTALSDLVMSFDADATTYTYSFGNSSSPERNYNSGTPSVEA
jgi:hypothetical protein